jgi:lipoyl(octanoyl) transferase
MTPQVELLELGTIDYAECWTLQRRLFEGLIAQKVADTSDPTRAGHLIVCEHPPVYTIGKSGREGNLLVSEEFLRSKGAELFHIDRGGDITYHGPGQVVVYPILDLERLGLGLRQYIEAMEQAVIDVLGEIGIAAGRVVGKTGVWLSDSRGERKICAIGVRSSRYITMHGLALNVATDLRWFDYINPCGFVGGAVTSTDAELGHPTDIDLIKRLLVAKLEKNMNFKI